VTSESQAPAQAVGLPGNSEMHVRLRAFDWKQTPLGIIERWPSQLAAAANICLDAGFAHFIWWGPDFIQIYNDAAIGILRAKHPRALGQSARNCWAEVWNNVGPLAERTFSGGPAQRRENFCLQLDRGAGREDAWFNLCFSAIRDDAGRVAGILLTAIETTERLRTERMQRESEARFRSLAMASSEAVFRMSADWHEMHNLDGKSFIPDTDSANSAWLELYIPQDDRPAVQVAIQAAIDKRSIFELEHRVIRTDGSIGWIASRAVPLFDAQGAIKEWIGSARDITGRKIAEEKLRESEERLRAATNAAAIGVCELDLKTGESLYTSPRYAEILGYETIPPGWNLDRALEKYRPRDRKRLVKFLRGGIGKRKFESPITRPGGEQRWISIGSEIYTDSDGNPVRAIGTILDITERKQREQREQFLLRFSDALRALSRPDAVRAEASRRLGKHLRTDRAFYAEIDENGMAVIASDYCASETPSATGTYRLEDFGRPSADALGTGRTLVIPDVSAWSKLTAEDLNAYRRLEIAAEVKVPLVKADRLVAFMALHQSTPRQWSDGDVALVAEVAERTWTAVERTKAEIALEQANRAKDDFLAMLGHELRNPLQPIMTVLELMRLRYPDMLARERGIIESQARHMIGMIDDLLDISRITRGKLELQKTPLDVGDIVTRAIETCEPSLAEHGQRIETAIATGLMIEGDRRRLVQVVTNLLMNAAKYSPPRSAIHISAEATAREAVVRVRDEGIGIDPALLPHVFESFTHGAQSLDRSRGGLGLGLAIVENLVSLHGGRAEAYSEGRDHGSEFVIRLPLLGMNAAFAAPLQQQPPAPAVQRAEKLKVLIVDDYDDAAESLAELLEAEGFATRVAHDGADALATAAEFQPAVALVDIGLPTMDGYEVARRLHATPGLEQVRLIAATGYGQESDRRRAQAAGFDAHIVKPIDAAHIGELVQRIATMP
jgi:PAS domain S-box-containing protein